VVGLADGRQWSRVDTEPVCLDDERLAAALRTLLDLGHRGVHPTAQKTSLMIRISYLGGLTLSGSRLSMAAPTVMLPAVTLSARRPPR
jgi:hypothetical protein